MTKKSVLVVEDNKPTLELMASQLREAGYAVMTAENGKEALTLLKMARPNVIVVDLQMSPIGGLDFAREMINLKYNFPLIMVTSDQSSDVLVQASKVGIQQVLKKPVSQAFLVKSVERALR